MNIPYDEFVMLLMLVLVAGSIGGVCGYLFMRDR